jgi:hypothetical protein
MYPQKELHMLDLLYLPLAAGSFYLRQHAWPPVTASLDQEV